jgi:hypothetical protein
MVWTYDVRRLMIGLAALSVSAGTFAAPATPQAPPPSDRPGAPVVLASAMVAHASPDISTDAGVNDPAVPQKPKRTPRVTTCRCGGQTETPDQ